MLIENETLSLPLQEMKKKPRMKRKEVNRLLGYTVSRLKDKVRVSAPSAFSAGPQAIYATSSTMY